MNGGWVNGEMEGIGGWIGGCIMVSCIDGCANVCVGRWMLG